MAYNYSGYNVPQPPAITAQAGVPLINYLGIGPQPAPAAAPASLMQQFRAADQRSMNNYQTRQAVQNGAPAPLFQQMQAPPMAKNKALAGALNTLPPATAAHQVSVAQNRMTPLQQQARAMQMQAAPAPSNLPKGNSLAEMMAGGQAQQRATQSSQAKSNAMQTVQNFTRWDEFVRKYNSGTANPTSYDWKQRKTWADWDAGPSWKNWMYVPPPSYTPTPSTVPPLATDTAAGSGYAPYYGGGGGGYSAAPNVNVWLERMLSWTIGTPQGG